MQASGKVGINTANPVQALDVVGNIQLTGAVLVNGSMAITSHGVAQSAYYAP